MAEKTWKGASASGDTAGRAVAGVLSGGMSELSSAFDPLNFAGRKDKAYQADPKSFQLGTGFQQGYGQMGLARENRQVSPQLQALLLQRAQGQGPSAAESQLKQGLDQSKAQAMSTAISNPNISPALAMRMGLQQQTALSGQMNQQAATLRAQEQAAALGMASNYALQQQSLNDQLVQHFTNMGLDADKAQLAAQIEKERIQMEAFGGGADRAQQEKGAGASLVGGFMNTFLS